MTDKPTITQADNRWRCHHCQTVTISKICPERCFECKYPALSPVTPVKLVNSVTIDELQAEVERLRVALEIIARGAARSHDTFKEKLGGRSYPTWFAVNELQMGLDSITGTARAALAQKEPVE